MTKRLLLFIALTLFAQLAWPSAPASSQEAIAPSQENAPIATSNLVFFSDLAFAYAGGKRTDIPKPSLVGKTVMLPIKAFADMTSGHIGWSPEDKSITLSYGARVVKLQLNSAKITYNGQSLTMPAPARSDNGVSYAPAISLAQALGLTMVQKNTVLAIGQHPGTMPSYLDSWHDWYQARQNMISKLSGIVIDIGIKPVVQNDRIYYMDHDNAFLRSVRLDGSNLLQHEEYGYGYSYYDESKNRYTLYDSFDAFGLPEGASFYDIADDLVYYFNDKSELWRVRMDGSDARKLALVNEYPTKIKIYGGYVYYTMKQGTELRRVKHDGTDNRILIKQLELSPHMRIQTNDGYALTQGWMEDGIQIVNNRLYYVDYGNRQLHELNLQSLKTTKLTDFKLGVDSQYISIDGDWVYFNVTQYVKNKKTALLYRVNRVTQKLEKLLDHGYLSHVLDGWIYYNQTHIYRMKTDGTSKQQITKGKLTDSDQIWHVANEWIVFNSYYGSRSMGPFKIKIDGTGLAETRRGIL